MFVEQSGVAQSEIEEVFSQLPLPYVEEEFKIDLTWKDSVAKDDLPPYVHIRRSILYSFYTQNFLPIQYIVLIFSPPRCDFFLIKLRYLPCEEET